MDTPTEKDYIDAKLQAVIERMNGDARAHQIATDTRLDKLDQTVEFGLKSVRDELNTRLAQVEASFLNSQNNQTKWLTGAIIAIAAVAVSITSLMFAQIVPKASTLIVIYAPPQPSATPPQATAVIPQVDSAVPCRTLNS